MHDLSQITRPNLHSSQGMRTSYSGSGTSSALLYSRTSNDGGYKPSTPLSVQPLSPGAAGKLLACSRGLLLT